MRAQQGGDQHGLRRGAEWRFCRASPLPEVFTQVNAQIGKIELVTRNDERHLLFDQPFALVRRERIGDIDRRVFRHGTQFVQLGTDVAERRLPRMTIQRQQNRSSVDVQLPEFEGIEQEIRQVALSRPRALARRWKAERFMEIVLNAGCERRHGNGHL